MTYDIHSYRGCGIVPDAAPGTPKRGGRGPPLPLYRVVWSSANCYFGALRWKNCYEKILCLEIVLNCLWFFNKTHQIISRRLFKKCLVCFLVFLLCNLPKNFPKICEGFSLKFSTILSCKIPLINFRFVFRINFTEVFKNFFSCPPPGKFWPYRRGCRPFKNVAIGALEKALP